MKKIMRNSTVCVLSGMMALTNPFMVSGFMGTATAGNAERMTRDMGEAEPGDRADAFQVILPTGTETVFDFIMDPQELIGKTEAAAYGDYVFEEGATLFFRRSDGEALEDYSSYSDTLVIENMGTTDVEVVLKAEIVPESMGGITMTDDMDFTDDTDASLYLALTDGNETVPIDMEKGAAICTTLEGSWGEDGNYGVYWFQLTGAVNKNGDWSQMQDAAPKVIVTWSVSAGEEAGVKEDMASEGREMFMGSQDAGAGERLKVSQKADAGAEKNKNQEEKAADESTAVSLRPGGDAGRGDGEHPEESGEQSGGIWPEESESQEKICR